MNRIDKLVDVLKKESITYRPDKELKHRPLHHCDSEDCNNRRTFDQLILSNDGNVKLTYTEKPTKIRNAQPNQKQVDHATRYREECGFSLDDQGLSLEIKSITEAFEKERELISGQSSAGVRCRSVHVPDNELNLDNIIEEGRDEISKHFTNPHVDYEEMYLFGPTHTVDTMSAFYRSNGQSPPVLANCYYLVRNSKNDWHFFYGWYPPFENVKNRRCREMWEKNGRNLLDAVYQVYTRENPIPGMESMSVSVGGRTVYSRQKDRFAQVTLDRLNQMCHRMKFNPNPINYLPGIHFEHLVDQIRMSGIGPDPINLTPDLCLKSLTVGGNSLLFEHNGRKIPIFGLDPDGTLMYRGKVIKMADQRERCTVMFKWRPGNGLFLLGFLKHIDIAQLTYYDDNEVSTSVEFDQTNDGSPSANKNSI
jgi:hypothetical protein